nr:ribosomal protein S3 [Chlorella desiccata (nom. nud.)]
MGQKVNPLSVRVQSSTRYFDHAWYSDYFFPKLISIDIALFRYLNTFLKLLKLPTGRFSIYHLPKTTKLYSFFCYPKQSREYKSKIFNISSGLSRFKTKFSSNIPVKTFSNPTYHNILGDPLLFQKIIEKQKVSQSALDSRVSLGIYNFIKSKSYTSDLQKLTRTNSLQYIKNLSGTHQSINQLVNSLETKKSFDFSHQLSHSFLNLDFTSTKNSTLSTQEILLILNQVLLVSKILKTPYTLHKKYNTSPQNNTLSEFDSLVKYNKSLETNISKFLNSDITLIPFQVQSEWQDAGYFADEIVFLLERRISFRQIKNRLLKQFSLNPHVQGVRITCSGRVGGKSKKAQRARVDSIKYGQTSLHVFSSQIDFAVRTAHTALGSTGVKVWICYTPSKKS